MVAKESSAKALLLEFLQRSYISGLQPLLLVTPVRCGKALWMATLTVVVIWTHIVIYNLVLDFIGQPTEIHMSPNLVHVANSPFPAVAVCSANKVSKRKLLDFAAKVYQHQEAKQLHNKAAPNVDAMSKQLLQLANFFINPFDEPNLNATELTYLHEVLVSYYNGSMYSARDMVRSLAPDCDKIILRGIVYGAPVNTSELFIKRPASSSVCCIFNYKRPSYSKDAETKRQYDLEMNNTPHVQFESNSILNSVQFVLQDDPGDDYTYTYLSNSAFQIFIFPKEDYATIQSTSVGEVLVDHNTIVEIPIQPIFFYSTNNIRQVTPAKRLCYFSEEGQQLLNQTYYSLNECLLICRVESMLQYCGCVSSTMAAIAHERSVCGFSSLPCLMKWKHVWYDFQTFPYVDGDQQTTKTFKQCPHCLPTCNGVNFKIFTNISPLDPAPSKRGYRNGLLKGLTNERPLAIIKFFFKLRYAQGTEMDMVGDWVELLNRFGGILSLMYGFSVISYIEILYYLTGKWFVYIWRGLLQVIRANRHKEKVSTPLPVYKLYWKELQIKGMIARNGEKSTATNRLF